MIYETDYFSFLKAVKQKLEGHPLVEKSGNVIIGETVDLSFLTQEQFPRFEIRPLIDEGIIYENQQNINHEYIIGVTGYIKRSAEEITETDTMNIIAFGEWARAKVFQLNEDKSRNDFLSSKFDYMVGNPKIEFDFELFSDISTIIMVVTAQATLKDTEV